MRARFIAGSGHRAAVIGLARWCLFIPLVLIQGCASLPEDVRRPPSHAIDNGASTYLGREIAPLLETHPGISGFYPLDSGLDALVARVALIESAERSLDLQYYIWHADTTGLLLDDMDTAGKAFGLEALDAHPNIEIRLFNPFAHRKARALDFVTDLGRVNRRMHNKSLSADNQATIVGGRNIGDEYFYAESEVNFLDLDVLGIGPVVAEVSHSFDEYWNSTQVYPLAVFATGEVVHSLDELRTALGEFVERASDTPYARALSESNLVRLTRVARLPLAWAPARLYYDAPGKIQTDEIGADTHLGVHLVEHFEQARRELLIVSPYFVPGKRLTERLVRLAEGGVKVRILTNSLAATDVAIVHAGYMRYRVPLLKAGVELYEFKPGAVTPEQAGPSVHEAAQASLHAKTFAFDGRALFVGSFNLDPRSVKLNTEMGIYIEHAPLAQRMSQGFDERIDTIAFKVHLKTIPAGDTESGFEEYALQWSTREAGETQVFDLEPYTGFWQRFNTDILSLMPIESQL